MMVIVVIVGIMLGMVWAVGVALRLSGWQSEDEKEQAQREKMSRWEY